MNDRRSSYTVTFTLLAKQTSRPRRRDEVTDIEDQIRVDLECLQGAGPRGDFRVAYQSIEDVRVRSRRASPAK